MFSNFLKFIVNLIYKIYLLDRFKLFIYSYIFSHASIVVKSICKIKFFIFNYNLGYSATKNGKLFVYFQKFN